MISFHVFSQTSRIHFHFVHVLTLNISWLMPRIRNLVNTFSYSGFQPRWQVCLQELRFLCVCASVGGRAGNSDCIRNVRCTQRKKMFQWKHWSLDRETFLKRDKTVSITVCNLHKCGPKTSNSWTLSCVCTHKSADNKPVGSANKKNIKKRKYHAEETAYKVDICPRGNLLYMQIYLITILKLLCWGVLGL